jgi:energy-coupling factor transporter ATP-binding protein EcfA2
MAGQGQMALLAGEPGIGKTRLLEELAGLATARGARVLVGRCYELEQDVAYSPILEAVRSLLPALSASPPPCPPARLAPLAELLPELREIWPDLPTHRPLPPDQERARLLASLAQMIRLCAQSGPLVLLLDDLHWADPSSLQVVHHLGRQVGDQALLLVGPIAPPRGRAAWPRCAAAWPGSACWSSRPCRISEDDGAALRESWARAGRWPGVGSTAKRRAIPYFWPSAAPSSRRDDRHGCRRTAPAREASAG